MSQTQTGYSQRASGSIAPTEEIPLLAASISPPWLLLIIAASLAISYAIVFASGFTNQAERQQQQGLLQGPLGETLVSYLVCLLASAVMLWFFQQLSLQDPWHQWYINEIAKLD